MAAMSQRCDWLWLLGINTVAAVAVEAAFRDHSGHVWWLAVLAGAWPGFVVSTTISVLCLLVLPPLTPVLFEKLGLWVRWVVLIAALVTLAVAGSALALALLTLVGHFDGWQEFAPHLQDTMRIAILVTLGFGIYTTMNEALRLKLKQATSEAKLASLESRVNPHFFFNTLNSIAELTRADAGRAERMTTQLASLMRSSLETGSTPLVPLAQEVQSIRDYLEIEQVRFGDRLRYAVKIPNEAAGALVPRLALQTVVENSIKYAVSPRRDGALVSIVARREGKRVRVEVTDDGPGFDPDTVPAGHGLALIRDRLELLFHNDAGLSVSSHPGATTVAIVVPASNPDA
jgi:signal transduction histidine kinase